MLRPLDFLGRRGLHTFYRLCIVDVVRHSLDTVGHWVGDAGNGNGHVLENDTARDIWVSLPESNALVAHAAANVDEQWLGVRSRHSLVDGEYGQPVTSWRLKLHGILHVPLELGMMNKILVTGKIRPKRLLEDAVADIVHLLILVVLEEVREGLESPVMNVEAADTSEDHCDHINDPSVAKVNLQKMHTRLKSRTSQSLGEPRLVESILSRLRYQSSRSQESQQTT